MPLAPTVSITWWVVKIISAEIISESVQEIWTSRHIPFEILDRLLGYGICYDIINIR